MSTINQVHIGTGGTFEPSGDFSTTPVEIDELFSIWQSSDATAITLHFHGGLVSESSGVEIANMMASVYEAANNHPLTFVWETGLIETFRDNLTQIHQTKLFSKILRWIIKRSAERFGGLNSKGPGMTMSEVEIEDELVKPMPFDNFDQKITDHGAARGGDILITEKDLDFLRDELVAEFEEDVEADDEIESLLDQLDINEPDKSSQKGIFTGAKLAIKLGKIAYRIIRRHIRDRDHGFYPTVVEEILREFYLADLGAWVWGSMKDKSSAMWLSNDNLSGEELHVGSYVLDKMAKLQMKRPNLALNLVGHSAGCIAICNLLATIAKQHSGVKINQIIFMAPAVRSDIAVEEIVLHPERYNNFQLFTMADRFERDDVLVPLMYTRSLLYFISGVLEPDEVDIPIAGMMRHATKSGQFASGPSREWADFISSNNQTILSDSSELNPDAPEGRRTTSRKHGEFDNNRATQESLTHILKDKHA